jgi:shikimate dehydrogenase
LSPKLHNYWLKENNINAIYDKKKIDEKDLQNIILKVKQKKINGINVTVPFKKTVIPYLDKLSPEAEQTQSVNTITLTDDILVGHNTDISGFTKAIKDLNFNIENKKIFILGAGGVVPSIIFALNKMNVPEIIISNRTRQKADDLKSQFKFLKILDWGKLPKFDVIINATSLGLNKEVINLNFSDIGNDKLFYDVIYNPSETNFLKEGKKLGNRSENGKLMFVYQALEAFKLWHGLEPKFNEDTLKLLEND